MVSATKISFEDGQSRAFRNHFADNPNLERSTQVTRNNVGRKTVAYISVLMNNRIIPIIFRIMVI